MRRLVGWPEILFLVIAIPFTSLPHISDSGDHKTDLSIPVRGIFWLAAEQVQVVLYDGRVIVVSFFLI